VRPMLFATASSALLATSLGMAAGGVDTGSVDGAFAMAAMAQAKTCMRTHTHHES
jgi:hypothetical protein